MATNHIEKPRKNEDPNRFIKRFIKKCKKLGIIDEFKERRYYKSVLRKKELSLDTRKNSEKDKEVTS